MDPQYLSSMEIAAWPAETGALVRQLAKWPRRRHDSENTVKEAGRRRQVGALRTGAAAPPGHGAQPGALAHRKPLSGAGHRAGRLPAGAHILRGFHGGDGRGWLLTIVRNTCYDWLRKNRRRTEMLGAAEEAESARGRRWRLTRWRAPVRPGRPAQTGKWRTAAWGRPCPSG